MGIYTKPSVQFIEQINGTEEGFKKHIEKVGRLCYKSADKITSDSYIGFVDRMKASKHGAMLEHGTLYLMGHGADAVRLNHRYGTNKFSKINFNDDGDAYVTTNYRVVTENGWEDDLRLLVYPTPYHERRVTVDIVTDRAVTHEAVRHRVFSFAQESQRYVNYIKEKFGGCITFVAPHWLDMSDIPELLVKQAEARADAILTPHGFWWKVKHLFDKPKHLTDIELYLTSNAVTEKTYLDLVARGMKQQDARIVLPNGTKTEIIMTGFVSDWIHFLNLRSKGTTGAPHPDMKIIADQIKEGMIDKGYFREEHLGKE